MGDRLANAPGLPSPRYRDTTAHLLTDAAFTVASIDRVDIHHDRANTSSAGVPGRLGYVLTAEAPEAPAEIGIDCTWTMTRRPWNARLR